MARCPECDQELESGEELCPNCGAIVSDYEDIERNEGDEGFEA